MFKKVWYFLQGHANYLLWKRDLLPVYLVEQIYYRFGKIDNNCFNYNECQNQKCGCDLTKQLFSNKTCDVGYCNYPKFLSEKSWRKIRALSLVQKRRAYGKERLGE